MAALAAGVAGADPSLIPKRKVHFDVASSSGEESGGEDASAAVLSQRGEVVKQNESSAVVSISELVRKSSDLLKGLTMTITDTEGQERKVLPVPTEVKKPPSPLPVVILSASDETDLSPSPAIPIVVEDENDPPDPEDLAKLAETYKKKPTMAAQWRKKRREARANNEAT